MASTSIHEIEEPLSNLMSLNLIFQAINKTLEAKYGLSIVQWSFLKTLAGMPAIAPLALAKALRVSPGTLSQTTMRLEKKKYIFVCNDPKDARKKMISLTRSGKDTLDSIDKSYTLIFSNIQNISSELKTIEIFLCNTKSHLSELGSTVHERSYDK
ncbi:MAG: hypothetical protein A2Z20_10710 [Bdellovibrionales bacterium RBG_16_40_8]|nr:MAG: hypothetical protein A2Z20_10710 [Bdellovibrionales bacterium RBG_16_40_8]